LDFAGLFVRDGPFEVFICAAAFRTVVFFFLSLSGFLKLIFFTVLLEFLKVGLLNILSVILLKKVTFQ